MNILTDQTDSLLILKSVSPYSEHFAAANGVHYVESLLYLVVRLALRIISRMLIESGQTVKKPVQVLISDNCLLHQ